MRLLAASAGLLCLASLGSSQKPERTYDLLHVDWRVSLYPETRAIAGTATNTLQPLKDGLTEVFFHAGKLNVLNVRVNDAPATFRMDGQRLIVPLGRAAKADETLRVKIVYTARPEAGVYFVDAANAYPANTPMAYTQGEMEDTRYWLPTYDYPDDKATSSGTIETPAGWSALSNGRELARVVGADGRVTTRWTMEQPHVTYLISFIAGPYDVYRESWGTLPVSVWSPKGLNAWGKASFGGTSDMIRFYSELTGYKYPYAKFAQGLVADFPFGGMENITAVTNTIGALHPAYEKPFADAEGLNLHELAHQWFGDTVTCSDWSHIWINEGFASFLPAFYVRHKYGQERYDLARLGTFDGGLGAHLGNNRAMVHTGYNEAIEMFDGYAYPGGASRLFMLMHKLGEKAFWKGIRDYLHAYQFKNAKTADFFAAMSKSSGVDLSRFEKEWFYTAAYPRLKVESSAGGVRVSQAEPFFEMKVDVAILNGGRVVRKVVDLTGGSAEIAAAGPVWLDPDVRWMAQIEDRQPWTAAQLGTLYGAFNAAGKAMVLRKAGEMKHFAFLARIAKTDKNTDLVAAAMGLMEASQTADLLALSQHADPRVRANAARMLGNGPKTDAVVARLQAMWRQAEQTELLGASAEALLKHTADRAFAEILLGMPSFNERLRQLAVDWLAGVDREAAFAKYKEFASGGYAEPLRLHALGRLAGFKDLDADKRAYRLLLENAQGPVFRSKMEAIRGLGEYGDRSAAEALRPLTGHGLHFVRNAAKGVLQQLGG